MKRGGKKKGRGGETESFPAVERQKKSVDDERRSSQEEKESEDRLYRRDLSSDMRPWLHNVLLFFQPEV